MRQAATRLLPFVLLLSASSAAAQSVAPGAGAGVTPVVIGERSVIHSAILGEDRTIFVYRPAEDPERRRHYPVMYLLDGPDHFHHATGAVAFLAATGRIPPMIVVAIANTDRTRDLTPPTADTTRVPGPVGGADRFLRFVSDELVPEIERTNRTLHYRVLVGHSLGGLFAMHAFENRPDLFQAYIVISPSLWWSDQALVRATPSFLSTHPDLRASLYITTGNEGGEMLTSSSRLAAALRASAPAGVEWRFTHMPAESHGSIPHRSLYDGLEAIFADLRIDADTTSRTIADLDRRYAVLSAKYGYSIPVPEAAINALGYRLLALGQPSDAVATFVTNTRRFPESANTFDSLGDAYRASGRLAEARSSYARAVAMARRTNDPVLATSVAKLAAVTPRAHPDSLRRAAAGH